MKTCGGTKRSWDAYNHLGLWACIRVMLREVKSLNHIWEEWQRMNFQE